MKKRKKKNILRRIIKATAIALSIPVILFWLLIVLLYIPPVQRFAIDEICGIVKEESGMDVEIGSFHLAFPLKLKLGDFKVSQNDSVYAEGEHLDVNVSLMPLLKGEVEVNYISLEGVEIDTKELLPTMAIDGNVGFFRVVVRNIDIENEIANIRQFHLHSANLNVVIKDTIVEEEEDSEPLKWVVNLHKGNVENCSFNVEMPGDTLKAGADIGKFRLRDVKADLAKNIYSLQRLTINNSDARYDQGVLTAAEAPLSHLRINEINTAIEDVEFSLVAASFNLKQFSFIQPGGIRVTGASAKAGYDSTGIEVEHFTLNSKNGSSISLQTAIPWGALSNRLTGDMDCRLSLTFNKNDLRGLLTTEEYDALSLLEENMLQATMNARGSVRRLRINTLNVDVPGIASLSGNGFANHLLDFDNINGAFSLDGHTGNIRHILGYRPEGKGTGELEIKGDLAYLNGRADANIKANGAGGFIDAILGYDTRTEGYDAEIKIAGIDLTELMPDIPLHSIAMQARATGTGFDLFDKFTAYNAEMHIDSLHYDKYHLSSVAIKANQHNSTSDILLIAEDPALQLLVEATTQLGLHNIANSTSINVTRADFNSLGLTDATLGTEMKLTIDAATDLAESHSLKFNGEDIKIITAARTFTPADISLALLTSPDTTYINAKNGDLAIDGTMNCGYTTLLSSFDKVADMYSRTRYSEKMEYYLHDYEKQLPQLSFRFNSGQSNILSNLLAMNDIKTESINLSLNLDTINGLRMRGGVYGFNTAGINLDTIRVFTMQEGEKIRYLAGVRSTALNPEQEKETYSALLLGNIFKDSLTTNFVFRDNKESLGVKIGATTLLMPEGLNIRFNPEAVLLGNPFHFDEDNFLNIGKEMSIEADITLTDGKDAGMHLYTTPDNTAKYNANLELFNVNLSDVTSIIPYAPNVAGEMFLDLHYRQSDDGMLVSCDVKADSLAYEGTMIGNEIFEVVYFPRNDDSHYIDIIARHEEEEIAHLDGTYINDDEDPGLHGNISLTRFPLSLSEAFLKGSGMSVDGYINSDLSAEGRFSELRTDGFMQFDSVTIDIPTLGTTLNLADELVEIEENSLVFENFEIYDKVNNPFKVNGTVNLTNLTNPDIDLRMNANDYELINSPRRRGAMMYGKMFIDFRSFIRGRLNNLRVFGNVSLLSKSNITYVMLDAPIESDKELDGLVEFVNFQDTTQVAVKEENIDLGNTNVNLTLNIEDGARINADFDTNRNSYIMLQGGGRLNLTYTSEAGVNLTGKYTMDDGQLKYSLPIIPLKTFNIVEGSYVNWNGDIFDPDINITALETVTSSVTFDDNSMQPVEFDVGVKLSNTLSNMGLSFTMSAPENAMVQDQLNMLDAETLNKYAVTMLITGAYMGGSKGMTVSSALSSFLDAKINDIAGSAMKSVNLNVGINDAQNAETGGTYKNYSFSFSKRFWNDRLTIVIGGEVNSGDHPSGDDSFINNVSLEWKISNNSNRYIRLFYDKNYQSILEGEITETGVGYVYKRKLNSLNELLIFKRKSDNTPSSDVPAFPRRREELSTATEENGSGESEQQEESNSTTNVAAESETNETKEEE